MTALAVAGLLAGCVWWQKTPPPIAFNGVEYVHRYSKGNLHEYTPKSQPNLNTFTDMLTINDYPSVKSGEALATTANNVLTAYKREMATIVRTNSVPQTPKKEAEHLIVALFVRKEFQEVAFARFMMENEKGFSLVYSHRSYGKKAGDGMGNWLEKNGEKLEKALMAIPVVPPH